MATDIILPAAVEQAADPDGRFVVAWQDPESRLFESIGLLEHRAGEFPFRYLPRAGESSGLRPRPEFPELHDSYSSKRLFVLFAQRLMNRRRQDYPAWLTMLGLEAEASALDVLARSEGQRLGDNIRIFPEPLISPSGDSSATFFVHGLRHRLADDPQVGSLLADLSAGERLRLLAEPANPVNSRAVVVDCHGVQLGWVPNPLLGYVNVLLTSGEPEVVVERNNGSSAPANLRLLIKVSGVVPAGYRPFAEL